MCLLNDQFIELLIFFNVTNRWKWHCWCAYSGRGSSFWLCCDCQSASLWYLWRLRNLYEKHNGTSLFFTLSTFVWFHFFLAIHKFVTILNRCILHTILRTNLLLRHHLFTLIKSLASIICLEMTYKHCVSLEQWLPVSSSSLTYVR